MLESELKAKISQAFEESWELVNTLTGWKPAKTTTWGCPAVDKVEQRWRRTGGSHRKSSGYVYRITATLPASVETVAALLRDVNNAASWNRTLQAGRIVQHLDKDTVIAYQMTATTKGLLFPRDFILGLKFGLIDGCFVAGGCSVDYNGPGCDEAGDEMVRAFLWPACIVARPIPGIQKATTLQWILDVDFKGWVPRCILETILPFSQVLLVDSISKALETIEKQEEQKRYEKLREKEDDVEKQKQKLIASF